MADELYFKNKKFRIMLVGDPHEKQFNEATDTLNKIKDYLTLQYEAVKELKPDLVVLMGDNASGSNPETLREVLLRITAPYREAGVPFTFILGNHDLESNVSDLDTHYAVYKSLPGIVFPETYSKSGDYVITIKGSDGKTDALNLWHIYNGAHPDKKYHSHYSAVSSEQINWYEKNCDILNSDGKITPAIVFQHVPVAEEYELVNRKTALSMLFDGVTGLDGRYGKYYNLKKSAKGYMGESPCTADYDCGQFDSWKKKGDVFAAFFGHDHMNDFVGEYNGITLGQCKTASFRIYGDGMRQGVRIIDLDEEKPFTLETEMVYYRQLIGNSCRSIHGRIKIVHDRTGVKLDVIESAAKYIVPVFAIAAVMKALKNLR